MTTVAEVARFLEAFAPPRLAAEWDNVGLLVVDAAQPVRRAMTCLTITPAVAAEAVAEKADLIVTHHPLPFHALRRLTTESTAGRLLLELAAARVAVYSPHTAFDSAADGINQRLAAGLGLRDIRALEPHSEGEGAGRFGRLDPPCTLGELAERLKRLLGIGGLHVAGDLRRTINSAAVACGAADDLLTLAHRQQCDAMVLGEARFHTCLEAESLGIGLLLPGHFASERFGVEHLAGVLAAGLPGLTVWASRRERDPLRWMA